jgi:hypothetical protein
MKPARAADRDVKPPNVSTRDGVTLHVQRSEDPERAARLLDILQAMVEERRRTPIALDVPTTPGEKG